MEAMRSSEKPVNVHQSIWHNIPEDVFYVCGSVHHNMFYEITNRCSYMQSIYSTARFTLHVSGVLYTHHQEYNF